MYIKVILLFMCVNNGFSLQPVSLKDDNQNIKIPSSGIEKIIKIRFTDVTSDIRDIKTRDIKSCTGECFIDNNNHAFQYCGITYNQTNKSVYVDVQIQETEWITANKEIRWNCQFKFELENNRVSQQSHNESRQFSTVKKEFRLIIHEPIHEDPKTDGSRILIEISVFVFLCLIIIGLVVYIVCKNSRANTIPEFWEKRSESPEQKVRYIKMPVQSSQNATNTCRESCIYEALDNIKGANVNSEPDTPAPSLPPLETLPRTKSTSGPEHPSPVSTKKCKTDPPTKTGLFRKRNKTEKKKEHRSSREHYIERGPMPLPSSNEDVYEDMNYNSLTKITPHLEKKSLTTPIMMDVKDTPFINRKLPSTPEELVPKQSNVQMKQELLNLSLTKPPKKPPVAVPPGHPFQPMPVTASHIKEAAQMKKKNWSGSQNLQPNLKPAPAQHSPFMRRDNAGASGSMPRPPPPSKPKKHSLPRPPPPAPAAKFSPKPAPAQPTPTAIHISTAHASDDSDEEWVYEDVSKYKYDENLYNI